MGQLLHFDKHAISIEDEDEQVGLGFDEDEVTSPVLVIWEQTSPSSWTPILDQSKSWELMQMAENFIKEPVARAKEEQEEEQEEVRNGVSIQPEEILGEEPTGKVRISIVEGDTCLAEVMVDANTVEIIVEDVP